MTTPSEHPIVAPLREGEVMGAYMDFDRTADKDWSNAEYLTRFGLFISRRTANKAAWQPIETAPKSTHAGGNARIEAVYFLAYCPEADAVDLESCICICWWEPLMKKGKGCWYGEGMYPLHPTHWMPLPAPPAP